MYKHIFIDLDDTIWDFHTNAKSTLADLFQKYNFNKYFEKFEAFFEIYEKRNLELWEAYGRNEITKDYLMQERFSFPLRKVGIDDSEFAIVLSDEYLDKLPTKTSLMPHAIETLDYLKSKGYTLSIISNGFVEVQYRKLKSSNITGYFDQVVLSEAAKALKPDKKIFEHAMQNLGAKPSECVMIGDSYEADIKGAQNANIDQIYYQPDLHKPEKTTTYLIRSLLELRNIL